MNCAKWQEGIALDADGEAVEGMRRHLEECAACAAFRVEMRLDLEALRSLRDEEIDAAHFTAVRARVMAELERPHATWRRWAWISAVAAVLVAVAVGWPGREAKIADPPRRMALIPSAPLVVTGRQAPPVRVRHGKRESLVVRLQTSDPNIVIYWIAD